MLGRRRGSWRYQRAVVTRSLLHLVAWSGDLPLRCGVLLGLDGGAHCRRPLGLELQQLRGLLRLLLDFLLLLALEVLLSIGQRSRTCI